MGRGKTRLAIGIAAVMVATLSPTSATAEHAGEQLVDGPTGAEDGLRHLAHAFVAYDSTEFSDFLQNFEYPGLVDAFVTDIETDLYNPFKGEVVLDPSISIGARLDYSLALVTNPWPYEVPNPAGSTRALWLGLDGTTDLRDANGMSDMLPGLAGSTHPSFQEFTFSFSESLGIPLGGSELAPNGNKISSVVAGATPVEAPQSAVYFLGGRTVGRGDDMGCSGSIRDRGLFFRPLPGFKGQERPIWDETTGADSSAFNDSFLNGSFGLITNCNNSTSYESPTLRSFAGPGAGFVDSQPNAVTYIGPFGWFSILLASDVADVEGYRLIEFVTLTTGAFTPDFTAGSIYPNDFAAYEPISSVTALVIDPTLTSALEPETEEEVTTEEETVQPEPEVVAEPDTTPEPEPEADTTAGEDSDETSVTGDDGGFPWALTLIFLGLALIALGLVSMFWGRSGGSSRRDPGGTRVRTRREHGSTPSTGLIPPSERETPTCDWALYFDDGGNRVVLREANFQSVECCVYDISVATTILAHDQVAKARQDDDGERLRIFDLDFPWTWVGLDAHTSTRSGPLGRLDWMQGLGDPTDQSAEIPDEPYRQRSQGEEPPEGAINLLHVEFTEVRVKLTPKCPEYENLYTYNADTKLEVMATVECTNEAHDPECPVELNAFGGALGAIVGDVKTVSAFDLTGTDPDELERAGRQLADGFDPDEPDLTMPQARPLWDGHDHDTRDRLTYEAKHEDRSSDVNESDTFVAYILTIVDLNAGQITPVVVYPTTERVSTHIEARFDHSLVITGEMTSKNCESNGCSGHGHCACNPKFKLTVARSGSWIDVDGGQYPILRIPTSADRNAPPVPTRTDPWELQK